VWGESEVHPKQRGASLPAGRAGSGRGAARGSLALRTLKWNMRKSSVEYSGALSSEVE
jgi:hypothetical protein